MMGLYNNLVSERLLKESFYSAKPFATYDIKTGKFKTLPMPLPKISDLDKELCLKEFKEELYRHGYSTSVVEDEIHVRKHGFSTHFELRGLFPYSYVLLHNLNKAYENYKHCK